jgi:hypothetical protein
VAVGRAGQPGLVEVGGDEGVAVAPPGGHPRHPLVQAAPFRGRDVVVEHVADEGVAEVEAGLFGARLDQVQLPELAQPLVDGLRVELADGTEQLELERPADHGPGVGHRAAVRAQPLGPGQHRVGQRVRDRHLRDAARAGPIGGGVVGHGRQQLLDMQGDAVAAVVDGGGDRGRGGVAEQGRGQGSGLVPAQPGQADLLGQPLGEQPGPPLAHGQARVQLVAAVGPGDQQPPAGQPGGQVGDDLEAELVGPVQVLEDHQHRPVLADAAGGVGQVLDQQPPLPVPVAPDPGELAQPPGHGLADLGQPGLTGLPQVAGQVEQQPAGGLGVAGEGGRPDRRERPAGRLVGDGGQQPGLADAGLAGHQQQVPPSADGRGESPAGQGEEVVAPHQDRRLERAMTGQPLPPDRSPDRCRADRPGRRWQPNHLPKGVYPWPGSWMSTAASSA